MREMGINHFFNGLSRDTFRGKEDVLGEGNKHNDENETTDSNHDPSRGSTVGAIRLSPVCVDLETCDHHFC
jgi:hypothetical protein